MSQQSPKVICSANSYLYRKLNAKASDMRNNPTPAEYALWKQLKNQKLGYKFRRQHIINKFIVDFYCVTIGLVIEVDERIHEC